MSRLDVSGQCPNGAAEPALEGKRFCPYCGHTTDRREWEGMSRRYCENCRVPLYDNPVPAVCAVARDRHASVLLVRRKLPPRKGEWCLPGGFMELGESPERAVLRELQEETGLVGRIDHLIGLEAVPNRLYHTVLVAGYSVTVEAGRPIAGDDAMAVDWFPVDRLPPIAFGSHRDFLKRMTGGVPGKW